MECIKLYKGLFKERKIINLDLFIDDYGLLWVVGRLSNVRLLVDKMLFSNNFRKILYIFIICLVFL